MGIRNVVRPTLATVAAALLVPVIARGRAEPVTVPFAAPSEPASPPRRLAQNPIALSGTLGNWMVDVDGAVYLRLDELQSGQAFLWFEAAHELNPRLDVQGSLVHIALARQGDPLTIIVDPQGSGDGATPEKALRIQRIAGL